MENVTGKDLTPFAYTFAYSAPSLAPLRPVTIPIAEASQLLRGLVQHVLSPACDFIIISDLIASKL